MVSLTNDYTNTNDATAIYPIGTTTVVWTAIDEAGNVGTCTTLVTVEDNTQLNIVCNDYTIALDEITRTATITPDNVYDAANSTTNCGIITNLIVSPNNFDCSHIGEQMVTLTAVDENNNTSCLLYTSPSPRDTIRSRMPSSA